jgi:hypothetical protein
MARLLTVFFFSSSLALAGQTGRPRKAEILRLEEEWRSAQLHNDKAAFDRLLAPDLSFVGTSGSLRDKRGYVASRGGSWIPRAATYTIREVSVRFYGRVAIVTGTEETTGEGVANKARFTHVWAGRQGRWRMVAIQRTDIVPP